MPQTVLTSQAILSKVQTVLKNATKREKGKNSFLTAYQILSALPETIRKRLIRQYGFGGKGAGQVPSAPQIVSEAAERVPDVEIMYLDTRCVSFVVDSGTTKRVVNPSGRYCGLFRLPDGSHTARRCVLPPGTATTTLAPRPSRSRSRSQNTP